MDSNDSPGHPDSDVIERCYVVSFVLLEDDGNYYLFDPVCAYPGGLDVLDFVRFGVSGAGVNLAGKPVVGVPWIYLTSSLRFGLEGQDMLKILQTQYIQCNIHIICL